MDRADAHLASGELEALLLDLADDEISSDEVVI